MSLLLSLKQQSLPLPAGRCSSAPGSTSTARVLSSLAATDEQVAMLLEQVRGYVDAYLGGHPPDDPVISPLTADLSGLPPLLIQAATGDPQREDAHRLAERARAHGVEARLELYPVDTHAFQTFWSFLPEAMEGLAQAGRFVREIATRAGSGAATGLSRSPTPPRTRPATPR